MRRFASLLGAAALLTATATSTLAADVQTVVEGGHTIGIAEIGRDYRGRIDPRTDDTIVTSSGTPYQGWKFQGRAGQCVDITMRSDTLDSFLLVTDGNSRIGDDDDSAGQLDAHLRVTLPRDGWYYLATAVSPNAEDNSPKQGNYTLNLATCGGGSSTSTRSTGPAPTASPTPPTGPTRSSGSGSSSRPAGSNGPAPSNGSAPATSGTNVPLPRF